MSVAVTLQGKPTENTAIVKVSANFSFNPPIPSGATNITISYSWGGVFSGTSQSPSLSSNINLSNLAPGEPYKYTAYVSCTCYYSYSITILTEEGSITNTYNGNIAKNGSDSITIYTHPGKFSFGAQQNATITSVLTAANIAKWQEHCKKAYNWKYQQNYNKTFTTVSSGDVVTAKWYNECILAMNEIRGTNENTVNKEDLITAKLISKLDFSGT